MTKYKVGVCESPPELTAGSDPWKQFATAVARERPHLFLLNEMPFGPWLASAPAFDEKAWTSSIRAHDAGGARLGDLGATWVASTRPSDGCVNQGFIWSKNGLEAVHTKQYFPDEPDFYEARWFRAGERHFSIAEAGGLRCGFLICTELMFNERARQYGRAGAQVILVPRATGTTLGRWLVALRMAAIVSGCYVLSSNRAGSIFGGSGWIIDPYGEVVAQTSAASPALFHEIDTEVVARAQTEYPCYVKES